MIEVNEIVQTDTLVVPQQKRNYSFLHKNQDSLDVVETESAEFVIPAQPGSCYWAILRIGYENHDSPVRTEDFIDMVAEIMEERDPEKWERFKNKSIIKTIKNNEAIEKNANNWRSRVETNIKTMTRHGGSNPYGNRLRERGHILRWEPNHFNGAGGYVLRTNTNEPLVKNRKTNKPQIA
jgi:hypothetical protein